jgi:pyruvate ferredoxin oxidoreductase alpha subunit
MYKQKVLFESGNELAAYAAKQINYHVMGYYPITPSTQIAEHLDFLKAEGEHDVLLIPADGEHGAAGICYGAAAGGGRVFNATSANGLLYALEQLPVQSGTRLPMVLNVACRTVSGPLSIKGDHSDIMYALNCGWVILFAKDPQGVYDLNLCALKIAERVRLPVIVAFDGFFTSHQKRKAWVWESDQDVREFLGPYQPPFTVLDTARPVTLGAYMNEPDLLNNKYQLHLAMAQAANAIPEIFLDYEARTGRKYSVVEQYKTADAEVILFALGSAFDTAKASVDILRAAGKKAGALTAAALRPWYGDKIAGELKRAKALLVADRQDSYGAGGGNMSMEIKAALQDAGLALPVFSRVYGLSGRDFYPEDGVALLEEAFAAIGGGGKKFDYFGHYEGTAGPGPQYFDVITEAQASPGVTATEYQDGVVTVTGGLPKDAVKMPKRWAPGHGACPGCGIPVNVSLLLKGIEGQVVLLFHTGCAMVVSTCYPNTAFRVPCLHNLFQNGAATLSGLVELYHQKQKRGELPPGEITFILVSGDGGFDIGMGPAIGTALRNHRMILFEYDNGGYMNTGYQLSYSTPMGARSSTSHVGPAQRGKVNFHKDTPQIMAATHIPYVATVAESHPQDFLRKAAKARRHAAEDGLAYVKCLSACPLNWGDDPANERAVIAAAVDCCYHPLYEVEQGLTTLTYNPEQKPGKIPVGDWFAQMGRTRHLTKKGYEDILADIQGEVDRRWARLKARAADPLL